MLNTFGFIIGRFCQIKRKHFSCVDMFRTNHLFIDSFTFVFPLSHVAILPVAALNDYRCFSFKKREKFYS